MGRTCVFLFVAAVIGLCYAQNELTEKEEVQPQETGGIAAAILQKIDLLQPSIEAYDQMIRKRCPNNKKTFSEAMEEVKFCAATVDKSQETWCSYLSKFYMKCSEPAQTLLEDCYTDEDTKYLPKLIFQAILSGIEYICRIDGEHIFELLNTCAHDMNYTSVCGRRLINTYQQFDVTLPKKRELCGFMESFKPCVTAHIKTSCANEITQETWAGLYDALARPCYTSEALAEINTNTKV